MDSKNQKIKRPKRQQKIIEDYWDCSVCTFRNTAEAFKCLMCNVRKGNFQFPCKYLKINFRGFHNSKWNSREPRKHRFRVKLWRGKPSTRPAKYFCQLTTAADSLKSCLCVWVVEKIKSIFLWFTLENINIRKKHENSDTQICFEILGTSTRKPRLNSALVNAQQIQLPGSSNPNGPKSSKLSRGKNKRSKYVRLKNIDRTTGQTREVTVNSVTVVITEYKAKIVNNRESRHDSSDYSESNDSRS